jgi:type IV pilus assembly protein PilN
MVRINLIPWRDALRQRRQRSFGVAVAASVVLTIALGAGVHAQVAAMIGSQNDRNQFLNAEISKLNRRIKKIESLEHEKASLLARMDVIHQLQESRPEIVHLMDELVNAIPQGVFLTAFKKNEKEVIVEGRAESNARVSAFMQNVERSIWISNPRLLLIENKDKTGTGLSHFRMSFDQARSAAETSADQG